MDDSLSQKRRFGLSAGTIKLIALFLMTLDHIAWTLVDVQLKMRGLESYPKIAAAYFRIAYEKYYALSYSFHILGRLAFPLFVFFIVEGVHHTRNLRKYALTVFTFAVLSEVPFNLVCAGKYFTFAKQNVLFTLLLCMVAVAALFRFKNKWYLAFPIAAACILAAHFLNVDYGFKAVIMACIIELMYEKKVLGYSIGCFFMGIFNPWEFCCLLSVPLLLLYNGERGIRLKYLFYLYYPIHLAVLYTISVIL